MLSADRYVKGISNTTTTTSTNDGSTAVANGQRQTLRYRFRRYIRDPWNIFDQLMHIVLSIAVILRFTLTDDNDFMWARYVYAINLIMFYLRILHLYYINKRLGPKVIVIRLMVCFMINTRGVKKF